jgi:hypothetical protein
MMGLDKNKSHGRFHRKVVWFKKENMVVRFFKQTSEQSSQLIRNHYVSDLLGTHKIGGKLSLHIGYQIMGKTHSP